MQPSIVCALMTTVAISGYELLNDNCIKFFTVIYTHAYTNITKQHYNTIIKIQQCSDILVSTEANINVSSIISQIAIFVNSYPTVLWVDEGTACYQHHNVSNWG